MRFVATAVLLLVCLTTAASAGAEADIASVVARAKPSVVTVITYDAAGKQAGLGTGFFVDDSHVVTCYHVIDGATKAEIKTADGKTYQVKEIAASDRIADVARLSLTSPVKGAKALSLSRSLPKQGEKVVVFGSPLGLDLTVSDGIVSAIRDLPGVAKVIQITAPISPGSSGSPVLNLKGEVVGVVTSYLAEGQNLNFAVSSEQVLSLKASSSTLPGALPAAATDKAWPEIRLGLACVAQGDYAKALPRFEAATRLSPGVAVGWLGKAYCCSELGSYAEAVTAYKETIRLNPDAAPVHFLLGTVYHGLRRYSDAADAFKSAIRIKPDDAQAHCQLGVAYCQLGRYSDAVDAFKQAIRISPGDAVLHCGLGMAYDGLSRYTDAIDAYKQAIRLDREVPHLHCCLGVAYHHLGRYKEAIEAHKQALRIKPDDPEFHFALGRSCAISGRYPEAVSSFKEAVRLKPNHVSAHMALGMTYEHIGDKGSALDEYRILKTLDAAKANELFNLIYK